MQEYEEHVITINKPNNEKITVQAYGHENIWQLKKRIELLEHTPSHTINLYNSHH
jgi:hypothetical protein